MQSCLQLGIERERYFSEVEGEVVRLALGIAERVLHREARMDPLLLAASVRLALEKLAGESGTVLRVPIGTADAWRELLRCNGPDQLAVEVVGDEQPGRPRVLARDPRRQDRAGDGGSVGGDREGIL